MTRFGIDHIRAPLGWLLVVLFTCLVLTPTSPVIRLSMCVTVLQAVVLTLALALLGRGPELSTWAFDRRPVGWNGLLRTTVVLVTIGALLATVTAALAGFEPAGLAVGAGAGVGVLVAVGGAGISRLAPPDALTPVE